MKPKITTYKKAYLKCESILDNKVVGSSNDILTCLLQKYDVHNLNITTRGITHYLKQQGYPCYKRYDTKPYIFLSDKRRKKYD